MIICKSITITGHSGGRYSLSIYPSSIKELHLKAIGVFFKKDTNIFKPLGAVDLNDKYHPTLEDRDATHLGILMENRPMERSKILMDINKVMDRKDECDTINKINP